MSNSPSLTRRQFLKAALRLSASTVLLAGSGGAYSTLIEPRWLSVDRIVVALPRLPIDLDGFTLVQLSDFHHGTPTSDDDLRAVVAMANQLKPDLIVLTGDYITRLEYLPPCAQVLGSLRASQGVFAILGNHDHWTNAELVTSELDANSIPVLRNVALPIERNGARLWLVGLDDVWEHKADLDRALHSVPNTETTILLAHEPDYADVASHYPIDLQLSGHSHGGQVRLPFFGAPVLPWLGRKYPIGLQRAGAMPIYTNRGIGMISPSLRFNCRPEVTLLTLRASFA